MVAPASPARHTVLLIGADSTWPEELLRLLPRDEWEFVSLDDIEELPGRLAAGPIQAVIMTPRAWSGRDLITLQECRTASPETALVVMAEDPVAPALKRAFVQGATAFLRWPASPETVLSAVCSGRPRSVSEANGERESQGS